jgi:hypothetical protein
MYIYVNLSEKFLADTGFIISVPEEIPDLDDCGAQVEDEEEGRGVGVAGLDEGNRHREQEVARNDEQEEDARSSAETVAGVQCYETILTALAPK